MAGAKMATDDDYDDEACFLDNPLGRQSGAHARLALTFIIEHCRRDKPRSAVYSRLVRWYGEQFNLIQSSVAGCRH